MEPESIQESPAKQPPTPDHAGVGRPWGILPTLAWGAAIAFAYLLAQSFAANLMRKHGLIPTPLPGLHGAVNSPNGALFAVATVVGCMVGIGFCFFAASMRSGISLRDYLALQWPTTLLAQRWLGIFVGSMIAAELLLTFITPRSPDFYTRDLFDTSGVAQLLLWVSFVFVGPVAEELFFRGFLFAGIKESPLRAPGAIIVTTLLFTFGHGQNSLHQQLFIAVAGFVLAAARLETKSVLLCMCLHAGLNFVITLVDSGSNGR